MYNHRGAVSPHPSSGWNAKQNKRLRWRVDGQFTPRALKQNVKDNIDAASVLKVLHVTEGVIWPFAVTAADGSFAADELTSWSCVGEFVKAQGQRLAF